MEAREKSGQCRIVKKYLCSNCGKEYSHYKSYNRHVKIHLGNRVSHECPVCDKLFYEKYLLKRHINLTHMGIKKFECAYCGGKYAAKENLIKHIRIVHLINAEQKEKALKCLLCESYFKTKIHLSEHIRKRHRNQNNNRILNENSHQGRPNDLIALELDQNRELVYKEPEIHTTEMVMINGRSHYKCAVCGIARHKFSLLQKHMTVHNDNKKYKCPSCDVHFKYLSELRVHMRTVHVIKCKSNNNKMLWNFLKDLNNDVFVKVDTTSKKHKNIHKNKKKLSRCISNNTSMMRVDVDNAHNYTHPLDVENKLSMPILDDESVTSMVVDKNCEQMHVSEKSSERVLQCSNSFNDRKLIKNDDEQICSKHVKSMCNEATESPKNVTEENITRVMKDTLLGQANVPLLEGVTVYNSKINVKSFNNNIIHDQNNIDNTDNGITIYSPSEYDLHTDNEYFENNILQVMGLNDIDVESCALFESSQSINTKKSLTFNTFSDNTHEKGTISGTLEEVIIKTKNKNDYEPYQNENLDNIKMVNHNVENYFNSNVKVPKCTSEESVLISNSSQIQCNQHSFKDPIVTSVKHVEDLRVSDTTVSCIITEKLDYGPLVQNDSIITSTSDLNTDINLNDYSMDISFDLNELSVESNNANISLTDIVDDIYCQNKYPNNTVPNSDHLLQTPEEKLITSVLKNNKNDKSAQTVTSGDIILDAIIQNLDNFDYNEETIKETQNSNTAPGTTFARKEHKVQDMSSINIEKSVNEKTNESSEISSATMPEYHKFETNIADNSALSVNECDNKYFNNCVDIESSVDQFFKKSVTQNESNRKFVSNEENCDEIYARADIPFASPEIGTTDTISNIDFYKTATNFYNTEDIESAIPKTFLRNTIGFCDDIDTIVRPKNKDNNESVTMNDLEFLENAPCIKNNNNIEMEKSISNYATVLYDIGHTGDRFEISEPYIGLAFDPKVVETNVSRNQSYISDTVQATLQDNSHSSPGSLLNIITADSTQMDLKSNCVSNNNEFDKIVEDLKSMSRRHEHKCHKCPASFQRLRDLKRHEGTHNPKLSYLCDTCGNCFTSKTAYKFHLKHHNSKEAVCWVCGIMISEISFARHKCVSTYEYECPICDKKFLYGIAKKRHMLKHMKKQ